MTPPTMPKSTVASRALAGASEAIRLTAPLLSPLLFEVAPEARECVETPESVVVALGIPVLAANASAETQLLVALANWPVAVMLAEEARVANDHWQAEDSRPCSL